MGDLGELPGGLWTLSAAFLTAVASVTVAVLPRWAQTRERIRERYAASTEILAAWIELPYRIARRTSDDPTTLGSLATRGHDLQEDTANMLAWVASDSRVMGDLYTRVVTVVRRRCGSSAQSAWCRPSTATPSMMNVGSLIEGQHELIELLTAWARQAAIRVGASRVLLWLPTRILLAGSWNRSARLDKILRRLE